MTSRRVTGLALTIGVLLAAAALGGGPTCERFLLSETFLCEMKIDLRPDEPFEECWSFGTDEAGEVPFQLEAQRGFFFSPLACTCDPNGSFRQPKFGRSTDWRCEGNDGVGLFSIHYTGSSRRHPRPQLEGVGESSQGFSFIFRCSRDRNNRCPLRLPEPRGSAAYLP